MSCHGSPVAPGPVLDPTGTPAATTRVLLVGGPNVGKSTLFNALTGARQHTTNAPGTTVELATGQWRGAVEAGGPAAVRSLVDLPGTYSLLARSADEQVTADAVRALGAAVHARTGERGVVVVVLDATALTRSLYLLAQVAETGVPLVVALTMLDLAAATDAPTAGMAPHSLADALAAELGVPVVPVDARSRDGGGRLALARAVDATAARPVEVHGIARRAAPRATGVGPGTADVGLVDELAHAETLFAWVEGVTARIEPGAGAARPTGAGWRPRRSFSDRVDAVLLNPWAGIPVFLVVVWLLFALTTRFAAPVQGLIDRVVNGPLADGLTAVLALVGLDDTWVRGLLVDGVLVGVGTVATFLPVMAVMFAALGVLEDSGYLARAAFVADRAMRSLGLDGRALLPLIVGFGCNLPALAATRTLPHARQRLLTGLLIPLTSCSARLTVYVLLAGAFFPTHAGSVIFGMYLTSVVLVLAGGLLLRRTAFRDVQAGPLILVLPAYQRPHLRTLALSVRTRVGAFVVGAGKLIVATMIVVWVLMAVPTTGQHAVGHVPVADSVYGLAAASLVPVLAPAGFGDDHAAAALLTGFVAKEVVVGSFAQSYAVTEPGNPAVAGTLGEKLRASFDESSGGHGGAAALAFMVFVLAYTPCVATLAEQRRLFGWRPTASALVAQLALAWVLAVTVFQVGSRL
ncbi:ferrous iron transporter B [Pengzhenrongella phosphoraccumulans]|uniref:ferrous iron transporter B n=1 Tax=Pengzhenrongella phosphoraccumulans TaxID=3114394 RepID=UPI003890EA76